jgi:hypothetical protein
LRFAVRRAGFFAAAFFTVRLFFLAAIGIYYSLLRSVRRDSAPRNSRNMKWSCQSCKSPMP